MYGWMWVGYLDGVYTEYITCMRELSTPPTLPHSTLLPDYTLLYSTLHYSTLCPALPCPTLSCSAPPCPALPTSSGSSGSERDRTRWSLPRLEPQCGVGSMIIIKKGKKKREKKQRKKKKKKRKKKKINSAHPERDMFAWMDGWMDGGIWFANLPVYIHLTMAIASLHHRTMGTDILYCTYLLYIITPIGASFLLPPLAFSTHPIPSQGND